MSRSHRKTPIAAITTAESDKAFKQLENRRARRSVKTLDLTEDEPQAAKAFGDPWKSEKDGKAHFDAKKHPKMMRK